MTMLPHRQWRYSTNYNAIPLTTIIFYQWYHYLHGITHLRITSSFDSHSLDAKYDVSCKCTCVKILNRQQHTPVSHPPSMHTSLKPSTTSFAKARTSTNTNTLMFKARCFAIFCHVPLTQSEIRSWLRLRQAYCITRPHTPATQRVLPMLNSIQSLDRGTQHHTNNMPSSLLYDGPQSVLASNAVNWNDHQVCHPHPNAAPLIESSHSHRRLQQQASAGDGAPTPLDWANNLEASTTKTTPPPTINIRQNNNSNSDPKMNEKINLMMPHLALNFNVAVVLLQQLLLLQWQ